MKLKGNKGITLVALIITIIVLLIIAGVTIMALNGEDGIIKKSKQAKIDYEKGKQEEESLISGYLSKMDEISNEESNSSTGERPQIGDKVAYNEGSGKTSSIDLNFVMKDMEWRILDVEDDGRIELISTQPTDSEFKLYGEQDWLDIETKLDTLCNDLYANGTGVTARSLKVEDINKLGNYDPITYEGYRELYRYKYDSAAGKIQYSTSTDNGNSWSSYKSTEDIKFKEPGGIEINSTNYEDLNGNLIIKEIENSYYFYTIADQVTQTTTDGISMARLITQGLNDTNDGASGLYKNQFLSSPCVRFFGFASFAVRDVYSGMVTNWYLWNSNGSSNLTNYVVRPVVVLPANSLTEKVDGVWQVNV